MKIDTELKQTRCVEGSRSILPLMTALFIESFGCSDGRGKGQTRRRYIAHEMRAGRIFRLPLVHQDLESAPFYVVKRGSGTHWRFPMSSTQGASAVRTLISGIARNYNNLLMGILGNATLIRLQLKDSETDYKRAIKIERLIQSGSFLIHMVLGYLGERRIEGKRMRLHQLFKEMRAEAAGSFSASEFLKLEEKLKWSSRIQSPKPIASGSARVLEVLFKEVQFFLKEFGFSEKNHDCIKDKLDAIKTLVARGLELTHLLQFYAGDFELRSNRVQLTPLVKRGLTQLRKQYPDISLDFKVNKQLPMIWSDRRLLECAVQQVLQNAVQAHVTNEAIVVTLRRFQEEAPADRCGVHMARDYVVITIQDGGSCIRPEARKRIFEPFFQISEKHGHAGLGLAAAAAILKAHGGYIQLQSAPGAGSTFKIYLPIDKEA